MAIQKVVVRVPVWPTCVSHSCPTRNPLVSERVPVSRFARAGAHESDLDSSRSNFSAIVGRQGLDRDTETRHKFHSRRSAQ